MSSQLLVQRKRWGFVVNNYNPSTNFRLILANDQFQVDRVVYGFERSNTGTPHLQGYLELKRTQRLSHVKKIFPTAHWYGADGNALQNYSYCTKGGKFDVIGDFSKELAEIGCKPNIKGLSVVTILKGLLDDRTRTQTKLTKEYSEKHHYFDKMATIIACLQQDNELFLEWRSEKLRPWQYECLRLLMAQGKRKILWVVDHDGDSGKSFLSNYLSILYNFQQLDGVISSRDLCYILKKQVNGFCFDLTRANVNNFDYNTLEAVKNGYLMSGKYAGKTKRFKVKPVVVFANCHPVSSALSKDRWTILTYSKGILRNTSKSAVVSPSTEYPFHPPEPVPDLSEDFDFREYFNIHHSTPPTSSLPVVSSHRIHTSQIAGPANVQTIRIREQEEASFTTLDSSVNSPPQHLQEIAHRPPGCPHTAIREFNLIETNNSVSRIFKVS